MARILRLLDIWLARLMRWFIISALVLMLVLVALGIFVRLIPLFSMSGYDEVIEWLIAWMTFIGMVALWREGSLFRVELISFLGAPKLTRTVHLLAHMLMLAFAVIFAVEGWNFASGATETMPFLLVSKQPWYAAMPISGALTIVYGLVGVVRSLRALRPEVAPILNGPPSASSS